MFARIIASLRNRVAPFVDPTVLLFVAIGIVLLWLFIDPVMAKTIAQWALPLFAIAAFVVVVSRVMLHHISFDEWIAEARKGNPVAGHMFIAASLFMGLVFIAAAVYMRAM